MLCLFKVGRKVSKFRLGAVAIAWACVFSLASCRAAPIAFPGKSQSDPFRLYDSWPGKTLVQGQLGLTRVTEIEVDLQSPTDIVSDGGTEYLPHVGGAWQILTTEGFVDFGVEFGFGFGWKSSSGSVSIDNGATQVPSSTDILGIDIYAGPTLNKYLGRSWRVYAGAGPLLQFAGLDVEYRDQFNNQVDLDNDGFGGGWYVRGGIEHSIGGGTMVGLGVRHVDAGVSFSGGISDIDFTATQYFVSMTQRL